MNIDVSFNSFFIPQHDQLVLFFALSYHYFIPKTLFTLHRTIEWSSLFYTQHKIFDLFGSQHCKFLSNTHDLLVGIKQEKKKSFWEYYYYYIIYYNAKNTHPHTNKE